MTERVIHGDALTILRTMPDASVHLCVTSPPYWGLRDYGVPGQLGLEKLHDCLGWATGAPCGACYICRMVEVFREVRRVLRADGTCWVNIGDSYSSGGRDYRDPGQSKMNLGAYEGLKRKGTRPNPPGFKPKDLCGIPYRLALALQADGWWLRDIICWHKPAPMPESVRDRCTKSWEPILMLAKAERYFFDAEAILEPFADARQGRDGGTAASERNRGGRSDGYTKPSGIDPSANGGRNRRNVWRLSSMPTPDAHFATFPLELPELCIKAGTSERGVCSRCAAPWTRVVERIEGNDLSWSQAENPTAKRQALQSTRSSRLNRGDKKDYAVNAARLVTTGWQHGCDHGENLIPSTVLDPFAGTATTGLACLKLGREFIGIELNAEYIRISEERARRHMPLLAEVSECETS